MLLSKTLRSSTLRLSFIYIIVFSSAIFVLLGCVYWTTVSYLYGKADQVITVESTLLNKTYNEGGRTAVIAWINRRIDDPFFSDWSYLLAGPTLDYVAGNLGTWPTVQGYPDWSSPVTLQGVPERTASRLRATYRILPDGNHLLLARNIEDLTELVKGIATGLVVAAALFLVLAAAAGISTSRRSVARIESINATSREIMRSGLGGRIPLRGTGDEWDGLAENLNSMLDRIEELMESVHQVSDNIAHDLRTPLARTRGRLERAYNRNLDLSQYHSLIGDVIAELDEGLRTFSSLLRISQIEVRDRPAAFGNIDLSEPACEVAELFDAAAEEKGIKLWVSGKEAVSVRGDHDLLFDAVSNLIDNAIKHGSNPGEVHIAVGESRDAAVLAVADRGPGIPAEERKHVLRRFYRLERSRSSPGNGLGLSLVAAVANLHGAQIEMADNFPGLRGRASFSINGNSRFRLVTLRPETPPGPSPHAVYGRNMSA